MRNKEIKNIFLNLLTKAASFAVYSLTVIITQNASLATSLQ